MGRHLALHHRAADQNRGLLRGDPRNLRAALSEVVPTSTELGEPGQQFGVGVRADRHRGEGDLVLLHAPKEGLVPAIARLAIGQEHDVLQPGIDSRRCLVGSLEGRQNRGAAAALETADPFLNRPDGIRVLDTRGRDEPLVFRIEGDDSDHVAWLQEPDRLDGGLARHRQLGGLVRPRRRHAAGLVDHEEEGHAAALGPLGWPAGNRQHLVECGSLVATRPEAALPADDDQPTPQLADEELESLLLI